MIEKVFSDCVHEYPTITARQVSKFFTEPFVIWAEAFAPHEKKDKINAFQEMLFEKGNVHEKIIMKSRGIVRLDCDNDIEGFKSMLDAMFKGQDLLSGPLIFNEFLGRADVLEKANGESIFGDYHYFVKEIKYAKNIKQEHILQTAFYTFVLGNIQKKMPEKFVIINHDNVETEYEFKEYEELLRNAIAGTKSILENKTKITGTYKGVKFPWESYSNELAIQANDVSLVPGLGYSVKKRLNEIDIFSLNDFIEAPDSEILEIEGVAEPTLKKWKMHASALVSGSHKVIKKPRFEKKPIEIFFDIEGDQDVGIDYLYGLLVRKDDDEHFEYFWASSKEEEPQMWTEFCDYLKELDDFVIYYYTNYESRSIKKMKEKYGCDECLFEKIKGSMMDLFPLLKKSVVLPLYSYSIKPVAKWLGFQWRADDASGANSIEWFERFLAGENELKEKILKYNEDDVIATRVLKDWMASL